jgi:hypothetical protein
MKTPKTIYSKPSGYNPTNWWKGVLKGLKAEDSSVSCAYANIHRADECLPGILPEPGL